MTIHINTISAINEVNMVRHAHPYVWSYNLFKSSLSLVSSLGLQYWSDFSSIMVRPSTKLLGQSLGKAVSSNHAPLFFNWSDMGSWFVLSECERRQTKWYNCAQSIDSHPSRWKSSLQSKVSPIADQDWFVFFLLFNRRCSRLLLKLDCQMKLQKFPLDNQTCVVNIGSCKWRSFSLFVRRPRDFSVMKNGFMSPTFTRQTEQISFSATRHGYGRGLGMFAPFSLSSLFRRLCNEWFGVLLGWHAECQRNSSERRLGNAGFRSQQSWSTIL